MKNVLKVALLLLVIASVLDIADLSLGLPKSQSAGPDDFLPPGTIIFGPETFTRLTKSPETIKRGFAVENSSGTFSILVDNGRGGENLVSSAVIRLNGMEIFGTNDFNQRVFNLTKDVTLQDSNQLEIELRSAPGSQLTVIILKPFPNPTVDNPKSDFGGYNLGDSIAFSWSPADGTIEYVRFRAYSTDGPWEEEGRIPGSLTNGIDITPEARERTLCYRLEARDENGRIRRKYDPICVPPYLSSSSHELSGLFQRLHPNKLCLSDYQFENTSIMSLGDIRAFLTKYESFLRTTIPDTDGVLVDPAQLIFNAAQEFRVNPQLILATLQKEQRAITSKTRLPKERLQIIMGFNTSNPTSIRQQIHDGTAQMRRDFDRLTNNMPTPSGWLVDRTKASDDPVDVTPIDRTVALLFSYTPWVGEYWDYLGGRSDVGGNGLLCAVWAQFDFPIFEFSPSLTTIGLWHFNNDFSDASANRNNAQSYNVYFVPQGFGGNAAVFNGSSSYLMVPSGPSTRLSPTDKFTLFLWINISGSTGARGQTIFSTRNVIPNEWSFAVVNANLGTFCSPAVPDFCFEFATQKTLSDGIQEVDWIDSPNVKANEWHLVTGVFDGSSFALYLDGNFVARKPNPFLDADANTSPIFMGRRNPSLTPPLEPRWFWGQLDEVFLDKRVWTGEKIRAYFLGATPK